MFDECINNDVVDDDDDNSNNEINNHDTYVIHLYLYFMKRTKI